MNRTSLLLWKYLSDSGAESRPRAVASDARRTDPLWELCSLPLAVLIILFAVALPLPVNAQLLRKSDFGVGVTVAIYQFDDARSKQFPLVNTLKVTANTPEEEIEYITKHFGAEDLKVRHIRSIGLREGEAFTDSQPMNERQLIFTITPRIVTKTDVTFDFTVKYDEQTLLEAKSVTAGSYETVMLRGERGGFGVREFMGPNGPEKIPEKRALLVTITPTVQSSRSLANKPSDISRPTDQFGAKVELAESDVFTMP